MTRAACFIVLVAALAAMVPVDAQMLVEWTEEPGPYGLGYPVPVPVDTPLPFDGFRTYAGLHARHQALLDDSPVVAGEVVGQTLLGREIWAYRLGTPGDRTPEGLDKSAVMYAGTVHAREWQSPEAVTGLMELMAADHDDDHWLEYVAGHVAMVVVPVINIDGFLQTQRNPRRTWLGADPRHPDTWMRDGRMRRKNHRGADEALETAGDHLQGVDLNRNHPPFWGTQPESSDPRDQLYRGGTHHSEPESHALLQAIGLAPGPALRFYADMHSYSKVFFSVRTASHRRNAIQARVFRVISDHHAALPGDKHYQDTPGPIDRGIGTTSEYFAHAYEIPSATWEIEPGSQQGAEYGGFDTDHGDGFILPESEIRRVRENLARSMAVAAYHMAGPPHVTRAAIFDADSRALVWSARWRRPGDGRRELVTRQLAPLAPGRDYRLWLGFSKPMRRRNEAGAVVPFPGQGAATLTMNVAVESEAQALELQLDDDGWLAQPGSAPDGYRRYRDDAWSTRLRIEDTEDNRERIRNAGEVVLAIDARDLTGHRLDADPSSVVTFEDGAWAGYDSHVPGRLDSGDVDRTLALSAAVEAGEMPAPAGAGHSAAWFDPARSGEGWMLEILDQDSALGYWFTYDGDGGQRWLLGTGDIHGNRIHFPDLQVTSGGRFGPDFDPDEVEYRHAGTATLVFADCHQGWFEFDAFGQEATRDLQRLSRLDGLQCPEPADAGRPQLARQSGTWYDPAHNGEGFVVQSLDNGRMLVMWFTYDPDGNQFWVLGMGDADGGGTVRTDELYATRGPRFGSEFDPAALEQIDFGQLELSLECLTGSADYESVLPGFGEGSFSLERLTVLAGLDCEAEPGAGRRASD